MTETAFIWDLDGTLIDSYPAILAALDVTYAAYGWAFDRKKVQAYILDYSVGQLLDELAEEKGVELQGLKKYYSADLKGRDRELCLFPETKAVLDWTREQGIGNFIYTHKGSNTASVLELLGIAEYFTHVVTSADGFARKPAPDALTYLLDLYKLDQTKTYYIGDRALDRDCALNAGIHSINLTQPDSLGNIKISSLADILDLPFI